MGRAMVGRAPRTVILLFTVSFASGFQSLRGFNPCNLHMQLNGHSSPRSSSFQPVKTVGGSRLPTSAIIRSKNYGHGFNNPLKTSILNEKGDSAIRKWKRFQWPGILQPAKLLNFIGSLIKDLTFQAKIAKHLKGPITLMMLVMTIFFSSQGAIGAGGYRTSQPLQEHQLFIDSRQCDSPSQQHPILSRNGASLSSRGAVAFIESPAAPKLEARLREAGEQARYTFTKILSCSLPAKLAAIVGASFVLVLLGGAAFLSTGQCASWRAAMFKVAERASERASERARARARERARERERA